MKRKYEEENGIVDGKSGSGKKSGKKSSPIAVHHKQLIVTSSMAAGGNHNNGGPTSGRPLPLVASTSGGLNYDNYIQQNQQMPPHMTWVPPAFNTEPKYEPKYENVWAEQQQQQQQQQQQHQQQQHIQVIRMLSSPIHEMHNSQQQQQQQHHGGGIGDEYHHLFSPLKFLNTIDVDRYFKSFYYKHKFLFGWELKLKFSGILISDPIATDYTRTISKSITIINSSSNNSNSLINI